MSTAAASPAPSAPGFTCVPRPEAEGELDAAEDYVGAAQAAPLPAVNASRFFYGWLMVPLATLVMLASAPGQTYGFAFFNPSLRASLSLSQTELSATYLLATLFAAMPLWYLGGLTDRFGLKRSVLAAVTAMAGACLLASTVENAPMLFVACVAMRMMGAGVMSLLANNTLAAWFDRRLGMAAGVMQMCMAAAFALVPVGMMALIAQVGWRSAYVALGVSMLAGVVPLLWIAYREHPRDVGQFPDGAPLGLFGGAERLAPTLEGAPLWIEDFSAYGRSLTLAEAASTSIFWLLLAATAVWSLIGTGLIFHLESLLADRGLTTAQAACATPLMAVSMAVMQLVGGLLADRISLRRLVAAALACIAIGCGVLATVHGPAVLVAYAIHGVGQGLMTVISSASWARYFGPEHLGRIRGASLTAAIGASALGPLVMGASADYLGGFEASLWLFVGIAAPLAVLGVGRK